MVYHIAEKGWESDHWGKGLAFAICLVFASVKWDGNEK